MFVVGGIKMGKKKKTVAIVMVCIMAFLSGFGNGKLSVHAKNKTLSVKIEKKQVKVGKQISLQVKQEGVTFSSSNEEIACISKEGMITGKKEGNVTIKAKHPGYENFSCKITVIKNETKPNLPVALEEVVLQDAKIEKDASERMKYSAVIKNTASKGTIKKIEYYYEIDMADTTEITPLGKEDKQENSISTERNLLKKENVATGSVISGSVAEEEIEKTKEPLEAGSIQPTETPKSTEVPVVSTGSVVVKEQKVKTKKAIVHITAKNIKAGKKSGRVSCEGDVSGNLSNMKLKQIKLYAGKALYVYDAKKEQGSLDWGVKDKAKPQFSGWIKKQSYSSGGEVYQVYYSDRKDSYNFTKYITAVDERDGKVKVTADTSKIDWKKSGVYKVIYTAIDKAGNKATTWAKVQVYVTGTAEKMADRALSSIIKESWSDTKKARAIYDFVGEYLYYSLTNNHSDWRSVGLNGLRYRNGDCYTHYAVARLLLTRAGIPNLLIKRYPVYGARHFWNLVYVSDGWYHFDATPRLRKGRFCLVTDAQLYGYSSGNTFSFDRSLYPKRATKTISRNP